MDDVPLCPREGPYILISVNPTSLKWRWHGTGQAELHMKSECVRTRLKKRVKRVKEKSKCLTTTVNTIRTYRLLGCAYQTFRSMSVN